MKTIGGGSQLPAGNRRRRTRFDRRSALKIISSAALFSHRTQAQPVDDNRMPVLVTEFRSRLNRYSAEWEKGATSFAQSLSLGLKPVIIETHGDPAKELHDITSIVEQNAGNIALNLDITADKNLRQIVDICTKYKAPFVTHFNGSSLLPPWECSPYYVECGDRQCRYGVRNRARTVPRVRQ
jgi:hypothetical protein